jgi:hypothetical protein
MLAFEVLVDAWPCKRSEPAQRPCGGGWGSGSILFDTWISCYRSPRLFAVAS